LSGRGISVNFAPATILLAEDIHLNRELIKGYLEDFEFKVLEAVNGEEAVRIARDERPDLILMDIKMPLLDGIEASRLLKDDPDTRSIPIVAVTASTMKSEEEKIGELCDAFLRKPISREDLLNVLIRFLQHSTTDSQLQETIPEEPFCDTDFGEIPDPEGLRQRMEEDLLPMFNEAKSSLIINQILEFAEQTIAVARIHKDTRLAAWGDQLRNEAMLFDMNGIERTLAQFPFFLTRKSGGENR